MNNKWIEWKGGECPVDGDVRVDAIESSGVECIGFSASDIDWAEDCDSKKNYPVVKYRIRQPDPHKEWVKIQEGCVMPDINTDIVAFHGGMQLMYKYFGPEIDNRMKHATHWRHPHPDPED